MLQLEMHWSADAFRQRGRRHGRGGDYSAGNALARTFYVVECNGHLAYLCAEGGAIDAAIAVWSSKMPICKQTDTTHPSLVHNCNMRFSRP
jgi:hypothetical protein